MPEMPPHGPQPPLGPPASRDLSPAVGDTATGVPDELIEAAAKDLFESYDPVRAGSWDRWKASDPEGAENYRQRCRAIITPAVLVRHEQMVLERKARDLEKYLTGNNRDWDRAIEQAVRDLRAPSGPDKTARGDSDA